MSSNAYIWTPCGDKVGMLTHDYQQETPRKIKVTICNHQADSPRYVWPDVWFASLDIFGPSTT